MQVVNPSPGCGVRSHKSLVPAVSADIVQPRGGIIEEILPFSASSACARWRCIEVALFAQ